MARSISGERFSRVSPRLKNGEFDPAEKYEDRTTGTYAWAGNNVSLIFAAEIPAQDLRLPRRLAI
jgi:hypothetical protein